VGVKNQIVGIMGRTVGGECALYMLRNLKYTLKAPVFSSHISPERFETEAKRLWRHVNCLLPHAGFSVTANCLAGKRVLVIGVGSTFGFALLLYSLGAETVVTIDPFRQDTDLETENEFIDYLVKTIPLPRARERAGTYVTVSRSLPASVSHLVDGRYIKFHPVALETEGSALDREAPFDLILSNAVLEHLRNIDAGMLRLRRLLAPGGAMAHEFGFENHTLFTNFHAQKYLTFPPLLWSLMTSQRGPPNRLSLSHYRRSLKYAGLERAELCVVERYSEEETEYAMRHAHPSVRADNKEDMAARIAILRVRAPAEPDGRSQP